MISFELRRGRLALMGLLPAAMLLFLSIPSQAAEPAPAGQAVMAWHVTIAPSWFDPSTAPPQITPFGMLYAIHDALVRPYPGQKMGPSLAQSWEESEDGLTYTFTLRPGLKFHNGDPVTTEDVKFSFDRYQGTGAQTLKDHVQRGRDRRPAGGALPPQGAVARLHDVLRHHRYRRRDRHAQEIFHRGR